VPYRQDITLSAKWHQCPESSQSENCGRNGNLSHERHRHAQVHRRIVVEPRPAPTASEYASTAPSSATHTTSATCWSSATGPAPGTTSTRWTRTTTDYSAGTAAAPPYGGPARQVHRMQHSRRTRPGAGCAQPTSSNRAGSTPGRTNGRLHTDVDHEPVLDLVPAGAAPVRTGPAAFGQEQAVRGPGRGSNAAPSSPP
jgi:hypothetical protein